MTFRGENHVYERQMKRYIEIILGFKVSIVNIDVKKL